MRISNLSRIADSAFLIHVGTRQLLSYIEKKHYYISKKVADIDFVRHPDNCKQFY